MDLLNLVQIGREYLCLEFGTQIVCLAFLKDNFVGMVAYRPGIPKEGSCALQQVIDAECRGLDQGNKPR